MLSESEHLQLAGLLREVAGLSFYGQRRDVLSRGVATRLRATGCAAVADYLPRLSDADGAASAERQALLDEVTVQETQFFRNPPQVRALRRYVIPELVRAATESGRRRLRVWSAGCATGEEAYTMAMLLAERLPLPYPGQPAESVGWDVRVLGTDISGRALAAARAGSYGERSLALADGVERARWFHPLGGEPPAYRVDPRLTAWVEFRHHNLVSEPPPFGAGQADLVLCRNVTIYLTPDATRRLVRALFRCLRPGGYLVLGHAETLWRLSDEFALVSLGDAFLYRRPVPGEEGDARRVLPDRRTAAEPWPDADRRVGQRRVAHAAARSTTAAAGPGAPVTGVEPDPLAAAVSALRAGRYAEAADLAAEVAQARPLDPGPHYVRGLALATGGQDTAAVPALRRAIYLQPSHGLALFVLAGALERLGERERAAAAYRAAGRMLARTAPQPCADELGGRSPGELAAISVRLADRAVARRVAAAR